MDSPLEQIARKLASEMDSRKSVEVRVTLEMTNHHPKEGEKADYDAVREHYIETAAGKRFLEFVGTKSGVAVKRSEHFGDGERYADVNYKREDEGGFVQSSIHIRREYWTEDQGDRRQVPAPLLYLHVGREPLHQALPKAVSLGKHEVMGRKCNAFLFEQVRWVVPQDQVFYLDEATSIPLKVESFRDAAARDKHEPMWVWSAESLDKVQDHFVVMKSTTVAYDQNRDPAYTWKYRAESVEFNKEYPPAMFWPQFQPGVSVFDSVTTTSYVAPGVKRSTVESEKSGSSVAPLTVAKLPTDWSTSESNLSLGLGCLIVAAGAMMWWRNGRAG